MNATAVIDTADILLAQPITVAPGETIDFSGTALTVDFASIRGGAVVMSASTADGTLAFVGGAAPYFRIDLRVADRTWRIARPTSVRGDILRRPDPMNPAQVEWLGRIELRVLPGSISDAIILPAQSPVLIDAQPYDGRIVTAPMVMGPQGAPAYPAYDPILDEGKTLRIVAGVPTWV
ncbi:hypothetical protein ASF52_19035 [Methylobacterium sp. Leaf112]|nr:hypothetical protein ASF52_19035 [Methylobacterium sp. Leaf112]